MLELMIVIQERTVDLKSHVCSQGNIVFVFFLQNSVGIFDSVECKYGI